MINSNTVQKTARIYTYETKGNANTETFSDEGYVTLMKDGNFIYEHQFSVLGVRIQEVELLRAFEKYGVKHTMVEVNIHE